MGQSRGWGAALARGAGRGGGRQRAPVRRAAVALEGSCLRLTARPPPGDRAPPSAPPIPRGYSAPQSRPNPTALPWRPQAVSLPGHGFPARGGLGCSRRGTGAGAPGSRPRRPLLSSGSRVALLPPPRGTKGTTIPQPCSEEPLHQALQFSLLAGSLCMSSLRLRRSSKGNVLYLWGGGLFPPQCGILLSAFHKLHAFSCIQAHPPPYCGLNQFLIYLQRIENTFSKGSE